MSPGRTDLVRLKDDVLEARQHCTCARLAVLGMHAESGEQFAITAVLDLVRDRLETVASELDALAERKAGAP